MGLVVGGEQDEECTWTMYNVQFAMYSNSRSSFSFPSGLNCASKRGRVGRGGWESNWIGCGTDGQMSCN